MTDAHQFPLRPLEYIGDRPSGMIRQGDDTVSILCGIAGQLQTEKAKKLVRQAADVAVALCKGEGAA